MLAEQCVGKTAVLWRSKAVFKFSVSGCGTEEFWGREGDEEDKGEESKGSKKLTKDGLKVRFNIYLASIFRPISSWTHGELFISALNLHMPYSRLISASALYPPRPESQATALVIDMFIEKSIAGESHA